MPNPDAPLKTVETGLSDLMNVATGFSALAALIGSQCGGGELHLQSDEQDGLAYIVTMLREKLYDLHSDMECAVRRLEAFGKEVRS